MKSYKTSLKSAVLALTVMGTAMLPQVGQAAEAEEQVFQLNPVYVTATRYERSDLNIAASTEVFTREKLEEMDCRSVMDVMLNIPGFTMSESPSGNGSPGMRGITGYLGMMINGIPLAKDYYYQMGTLSTAGIERIEVVKGGSSVLYGGDAATGVINIITRKGRENRIRVGAGNNSQKLISGYTGDHRFNVSYDWFNIKDHSFASKNATGSSYTRDNIKRTNYTAQFNPNDKVNVMFMHNEKNADTGIVKKGVKSGNWKNKTKYDMLQASYKDKDFRAIAYFQDRMWDYAMTGSTPGIQKGYYYGLDLQDRWDLGKTKLTVGGTFEIDHSKRTSNKGWITQKRNHGSAYILTENQVAKKTEVLVGAREVFTGDCGNHFNPQFQILQKPTEKDSVYLNVNKSLLEAPISRRYSYSDTQLPNPDLKPEKGWTYELGWKKQVTNNGMLKFDVFHMEIKDRMYSRKITSGEFAGCTIYENALKYKNTGVEVSYDWAVSKGLSYGIGLSYGDPKQVSAVGKDWERQESRLGGHAEISYRLGKFSTHFFGNYTGERSTAIKHYINVDMNTVYKMTKNDTVSFKLNNILDRHDSRSASGGSLQPERGWMLSYERKF